MMKQEVCNVVTAIIVMWQRLSKDAETFRFDATASTKFEFMFSTEYREKVQRQLLPDEDHL